MANSRYENVKDKAQETATSAGQTFQEAKGAAKETAANVGQQAREMASNAADKAKELGQQAGAKAGDAIHSVGQGMSSLAGTLRENAPQSGMLGSAAGTVAAQLESGGRYLSEHDLGEIGKDVSDVIRRYPIPALVCVFGIGFLLGGALRR